MILGGVAGVLVLAAIVYYVTRPGAQATVPREIRVNCACLACGKHVRVEAALNAPRPFKCPECGERAVYPLFVCNECGVYFVPNLERRGDSEFPKLPIMPHCPSCGSALVGAYTGDEDIPAEELVLPEWP